jgi:hypothetical protein
MMLGNVLLQDGSLEATTPENILQKVTINGLQVFQGVQEGRPDLFVADFIQPRFWCDIV